MDMELVGFICFVLIFKFATDTQLTQAAVGECNFDKYATGCYSQANFICDFDTNLCKCHPELPVLIEHRLCVKRAKVGEICQYNDQCDNPRGIYCTYNDFRLVNSTSAGDFIKGSREPSPRCRNLKTRQTKLKHQLQQQHQNSQLQPIKQNLNSSQASPRYLPRLVWVLLLASLFGLILLLLLIKSQYHRIGRSFQPQEDRVSINSELDVPPPYEVAIRMKL